MEKIALINGSPRAPKSNSAKYLEIFKKYYAAEFIEYQVTSRKHKEFCQRLSECDKIVFAFPLYADGIPVTLMDFLKVLESEPLPKKPIVNLLINCGFFEPEQNLTAVSMMKLFCSQNGFSFGTTLCIGSGEAVLETPFSFLVERKIRKAAENMKQGTQSLLKVTMPLPKRVYLSASTKYWVEYGRKNGVSKEKMETMQIEGN